DRGRDALASDMATAGAGASMALELGDHGRQPRQFGQLMPGRLRIIRPGLSGQRGLAALAMAGDQRDGVRNTVGRPAETRLARMAGLPAGLAARAVLGHGLG